MDDKLMKTSEKTNKSMKCTLKINEKQCRISEKARKSNENLSKFHSRTIVRFH